MNTEASLQSEINKGRELIRSLRDEVRLKLHLASMDVKEEWRTLEPYLIEVERTVGEATEATSAAVSEAVRRISRLHSSLVKG
jgi:hypothetical protein